MNSQLDLIREYLAAQPVTKAFLFGSSTVGDIDTQSDLSMLVEMMEGSRIFDFIYMKFELEAYLKKSVTLVSTWEIANGEHPPIEEKDKVLFYEMKTE